MIPFPDCAVEGSLAERFDKVAAAVPDHPALRSSGISLNYRELSTCAARVAREVIVATVKPEVPVLLLLGHGPLEIIALLAVLKSGRSYVVLDPDLPGNRLQQISDLVESDLVLTTAALADQAEGLAARAILIGEVPALLAGSLDQTTPLSPSTGCQTCAPGDLAAVVFTSGSTGTPKGVMRSHRTILHRCRLFHQSQRVGPDDRVAHLFSCSFVAAEVDVFGSLLSGATLCCYPARRIGFSGLAEWLADEGITLLHPPPTLWRRFLASRSEPLHLPALRTLFLAGEAIFRRDVELVGKLLPGVAIEHRLSCSETSILARQLIDPASTVIDEEISVGAPVDGKRVRLVAADGSEVPLGDIGEIEVESRYLATGYWREPEMTAQRFIPVADQSAASSLIRFRTGDLGRFDAGGERLFHLGRRDEQLKIAGHRVEPREVEAALLGFDGIREAAVLGFREENGELQLAAAVAPQGATPADIRRRLAQRLPLPMIPARILVLKELPVTPTGKIDRLSLSNQLRQATSPARTTHCSLPKNACRAPVSPHDTLADLWGEVLRNRPVAYDDNFFDLGGSSLQAAELADRIEATFACRFPLPMVYRAPTIRAQLRLLGDGGDDAAGTLYRDLVEAGKRPIFWIVCGFNEPGIPVVPLTSYLEVSPTHDLDGASLEYLAAEHVAAILRMAPDGPYRLGGYSTGGLLAIEAARQLQELGETVELLYLVDPKIPGFHWLQEPAGVRLGRFIRRLADLNVSERWRYVRRVIWFYLSGRDLGLRLRVCKLLLNAGKPLPPSLRRYYAKRIYRSAAAAGVRPYAGPAVIHLRKNHPALPDQGWRRTCPDAEISLIDTFEHDDANLAPWNHGWLDDLRKRLQGQNDHPAELASTNLSTATGILSSRMLPKARRR